MPNSFNVDVQNISSSQEYSDVGGKSISGSFMSYEKLSSSPIFSFVASSVVAFLIMVMLRPSIAVSEGKFNYVTSVVVSIFVGFTALFLQMKM